MSEAQALSGELIDLKKARSNRLNRGPSVVSRQSLDLDGLDLPQQLDDLQWPVDSLNKAIRDVEDRITRELRDGITSHDPGPILRDLKAEVTQVRSRLDELNERIEQICAPPAPRPDREQAPPPAKDIGALETLLAALAEKIDSAIAPGGRGGDGVEPIHQSEIMDARLPTTTAASAPKEARFERRAAAMYSQRLHAEIDVAGGSAVFSSETATLEAHADHGRVIASAARPQGAEATQRVLLALLDAARWTKRRAPAETKWVHAPKSFDPGLWAHGGPQQLPPSHGGKRDRVGGFASLTRASVFGLTGLVFVFCGYALSRPAEIGSGVGSSGLPARDALKLGVGVALGNTVDSAMASLLRTSAVAGPQVIASPPLQSALSLIPPARDEAASRDPVARASHPTSAPIADSNMSEAEVQAIAEKGDARAQYELATRLLMRQEKGADVKLAVDWLEKAARQDFALAQLRLGILYGKGVGVNRDYALARKWFQAAAENGNALAMHNLAVLIGEGHGRKPDATAANAWYHKAAELGVVDSQYNLGLDYMQGVGVERDLVLSYAWFATAAAGGDAKASKKRKEIAALLDPEELESARALASRLKQKQASTAQADD